LRGRPSSRSGLLAWGSRIHSATEYISWRPVGLRILLAAFIATLALLGLRSVAVPAMAAPASTVMHSPSQQQQTAPDEDTPADPSAPNSPERAGDAVADQPADDAASTPNVSDQTSDGNAPAPDVAEPAQDGDAPSTRITPTSRGGSRTLDSMSISPAPETMKSNGDRIAAIAREYVGYSYRWAGMSPSTGFDCSGLMGYVYQEAGISVPIHSLAGMLSSGKRVGRDELQPGDLLFFENTYEWGLSHGGIYVGNGEFVHAENESVGVTVSSLNGSSWASHYLGASRPW